MGDLDIAETAKRIALTDRGIYPACLEGARGDCEMCADMAARIASALQAERQRAEAAEARLDDRRALYTHVERRWKKAEAELAALRERIRVSRDGWTRARGVDAEASGRPGWFGTVVRVLDALLEPEGVDDGEKEGPRDE